MIYMVLDSEMLQINGWQVSALAITSLITGASFVIASISIYHHYCVLPLFDRVRDKEEEIKDRLNSQDQALIKITETNNLILQQLTEIKTRQDMLIGSN